MLHSSLETAIAYRLDSQNHTGLKRGRHTLKNIRTGEFKVPDQAPLHPGTAPGDRLTLSTGTGRRQGAAGQNDLQDRDGLLLP